MSEMISFRPFVEADLEFLYQIYASTRQDELALVDWTFTQKEGFLHMQFDAQHQYYQEHYSEAEFQIVLYDDQPCGRLYLSRWETEFRIVDIALLPEFRGQGIGSTILKDILVEAGSQKLPVSIHVEQFNPAMRLYLNLGFKKIDETGVYHLMKWTPSI
ncbi:GNAT family N-acetyltransferase [Chloroflexota bacterium]